jgi:hypothetical protein
MATGSFTASSGTGRFVRCWAATRRRLELAIVDRRLRFFSGFAELVGSRELIARMSGMMDGAEARADDAEARAGDAEIRALQRSVLLVLSARQETVPADVAERIAACRDVSLLERWLQRAIVVGDARELVQHLPG